jgi:hypothetical protein
VNGSVVTVATCCGLVLGVSATTFPGVLAWMHRLSPGRGLWLTVLVAECRHFLCRREDVTEQGFLKPGRLSASR